MGFLFLGRVNEKKKKKKSKFKGEPKDIFPGGALIYGGLKFKGGVGGPKDAMDIKLLIGQ